MTSSIIGTGCEDCGHGTLQEWSGEYRVGEDRRRGDGVTCDNCGRWHLAKTPAPRDALIKRELRWSALTPGERHALRSNSILYAELLLGAALVSVVTLIALRAFGVAS